MITQEDPRAPGVRALLEAHLALMRDITPPEDVHALAGDGFADPAVTFFAWREASGALLGVGALREIDPSHGELKAMHTVVEARGRGVGRALAEHLLAVARERGYERVSIETGASEHFAPARRLYAGLGFEDCGPFAGYADSSHSHFMTLTLG